MATRHIVVMGLMATGKSTIGRALAEHLGLPFVDNDELLEARYGMTAAELQSVSGWAGLHRREAAVLLDSLRRPERSVITAAASVVEDGEARRQLRHHVVVCLEASAAVMYERLHAGEAAGDEHRPDQGPDEWRALEEHVARRTPLFAAVADVRVDTTSSTPEQVLAEVLARVEPG